MKMGRQTKDIEIMKSVESWVTACREGQSQKENDQDERAKREKGKGKDKGTGPQFQGEGNEREHIQKVVVCLEASFIG